MRITIEWRGRRQQQTDGPSTGRPETRVSGMRARVRYRNV